MATKEQQRDKYRQQGPVSVTAKPNATIKRRVKGVLVILTPKENAALNRSRRKKNKKRKPVIMYGHNTK